MSVQYTITTGKGTTRDYVINSNSVYPISSYTGMPVTLSVNLSNLPISAHNNFIVFSINDNFLLKENNSVYNFPLPGVYKITLFTADLSGEPIANYTSYLSAFNFITDIINPVISAQNNVYKTSTTDQTGLNTNRNVLSSVTVAASKFTDPISVYRYNTWQLCEGLSALDYKIDLYCDSSQSNDLENKNFYQSKWFHLLPTWQFRNENKSTIIRTLSTDSTNLYLTYDGYTGAISTVSSVNCLFTGTSGKNIFYFKDETPTNVYGPDPRALLYLTQNLKDVPLASYILDNKYLSIFNKDLPIINNISTYIEGVIDYTVPYSWSITSNGFQESTLPNILINGSFYPIFVTPADDEDNLLKYYGNIHYIPTSAAFNYNTFKLALLSADGTKDVNGNNNLKPTNFQIIPYENNEINTTAISSFFIGALSTTYTDSFKSIGVTTNFYLSTINNNIVSAPFSINPVVLSAFGLARDTDGFTKYVEGIYLFNYYPRDLLFNVMKINENFDYVKTLKSYALMPSLIEQTQLFDNFFAYVGGSQESSPNSIGKKYYEKIANFTSNNADLDGANITQLYELFNEINYQSKNYNVKFPADLQRWMDLLSINYSKLVGYNTGFNSNYKKSYNVDIQYSQTNLGQQLNNNSLINAGQNIVVYQFFDDLYYTVTPSTVACNTSSLNTFSAANLSCIDITFNGLSTYPLSCYQNNWGWGLPVDINWNSINQQYYFYLQKPTVITDYNKLDSYIDWSNNQTTLSAIQYNNNLLTYFSMSGGLAEQYIENTIRRGVGLI
jgi:hypothetical protein